MKLVVFGLGYTARAFVRRIAPHVDEIVATRRPLPPPACGGEGRVAPKERTGVGRPSALQSAAEFASTAPHPGPPLRSGSALPTASGGRVGAVTTLRAFPGEETALAQDIAEADAILVSVPPDPALPAPHDPVLAAFAEAIRHAPKLRWLGYLSTIGVYGDHDGAWVDEETPPRPVSRRSKARLATEEAWLGLAGVPVHVFRIAGIYGPGRSAFDKLASGTAQRLVKPGQVFNRAHVDDIAAILEASLAKPRPGGIYNVTDDEPAPPQDVIVEAARLAGIEPPPEVPFDAAGMSPMAASFWGETKRVSNRRIREELGVALRYPTYREGLRGILAAR